VTSTTGSVLASSDRWTGINRSVDAHRRARGRLNE
jgi:hypothetical protein